MEREEEVGARGASPRSITPAQYTASNWYHDKWYAIIFYVQFALFIAMAAYCIVEGRISLKEQTKNALYFIFERLAWRTGNIFITSFVLTCVCHFLIRRLPTSMLHVSTWILFLEAAAFSILSGYYVHWLAGTLYGLLTLIVPAVYLGKIKNMVVSGEVLKFISLIAHRQNGLIALMVISSILVQVYVSIITLAVYGIIELAPVSLALVMGNFYVVMGISLYWTVNVILNILRTIVAGVYGRSYQETPDILLVKGENPTWTMTRRSLGRAFGSICKGSIMVSTVSTIQDIICGIHYWSPVTNKALEEAVVWINSVARNWNFMAFTHVALYMPSYRKASNATWDRMTLTGVGKVTGDLYIGWFTCFLSFAISLFAAFLDLGVKIILFNSDGSNTMESLVKPLPASIVLGIVIPQLYFMILESGVTATFVCYADDQRALAKSDPLLRELIKQRYPDVHKKHSLPPLPSSEEE